MAIIQKISVGEDVEEMEVLCVIGGVAFMETSVVVPRKVAQRITM